MVLESTTYPGTTAELPILCERMGIPALVPEAVTGYDPAYRPFGDGRSGEKIVDRIRGFFE